MDLNGEESNKDEILVGNKAEISEKRQKTKAYISGVAFAIMVGFTFLAVKVSIETSSALEILVFRYNFAIITSIVAIIYLKLKGRSFSLSNRPLKNLFLTSVFYVAFMAIQALGLIYCTSIESGIFFAIIPIITKVLAGIFLGEKTSGIQTVFLLISVASVIIMIIMGSQGFSSNLFGIVLLLVSSLCMAISNVFMRYVRNEYKPLEIATYISGLGFLGFNGYYLMELFLKTGSISGYFRPCEDPMFVVSSIYLGGACIVGSVLLMAYMLRYLETVKATVFGNVSTAISILAGLVILHEPLKAYHVLCTVLIIIGVIGVAKASAPKK